MAMLFLAALLSVFTGFVVSVPDGFKPVDCSDLYKAGQTVSGIYSIYPAGDTPVWVYCHMISDGKDEDKGGWTVIQRRMDGSINFYRPWNQYKKGFGKVESEYWLGLENMYQLTRNRKYMLRVDLEDFEGKKGFALYSSFSVDCENEGYKLHVSGFTDGGAGDSLSGHNDQKFTTFDKDQDPYKKNCAKLFLGAFWYTVGCHYTNPNGVYLWGEHNTHHAIGVVWRSWKNSFSVSVKSISMKIKRVS
ncbi:microfibril-associated glycoprotein 4-like isoform X3 [Ctenopharyngodon idella]|uniref:microfibril-associated glycoprotein 4-like isoform X1 n=1 Tax=Ctenopharyngodon idella TaxID=7959 RepID=UPI0022303BA3|nr:microfibril-associated glycoprotein 4-like isoform X1 [Ctenopharyngodon idella]XP_051760674.1 microfibril-associated glycoprotein 4-like isoform X2 [Ctenopharyngodon idella]XP_051760683.1 microfibril-associated glycoprotein 4-like isoform X3 [Ctenopharyngodon idella]